MSATSKAKTTVTSTVEAIRMASVSVLGSTTTRGFPVGAAVGLGSMMEENSETVAMNVGPLVFSVRDSLRESEGLELLSLIWDLERTPSSELLPEQLVVAGSSVGEVSSHACMLTWERGIVDPFKVDANIRRLTKKMADIEVAVLSSGLDYDREGLAVLRRFADRFNRVMFVDMLDRQFQSSYNTMSIKPDDVDLEAVVKVKCRKDFSTMPPGLRVLKPRELQLVLPKAEPAALSQHFKHRIMTPNAMETLVTHIPEMGRTILGELNAYAYSGEEVNIATTVIEALVEYIGRDSVKASELDKVIEQANSFAELVAKSVDVLSEAVEQHISSGLALLSTGHRDALMNVLTTRAKTLTGRGREVALKMLTRLLDHMMDSVGRAIPQGEEARAWQLKGTLRYFVTYARKVAQYFAEEFRRFLVVTLSRKTVLNAIIAFRQELTGRDTSPTDLMLSHKFIAELYSMLNAAFDKATFEGVKMKTPAQLMDVAIDAMIEGFGNLDVSDLISFSDTAQIARLEVTSKHTVPGADQEAALDSKGKALMDRLSTLEALVGDISPNIAGTVLARPFLSRVLDAMRTGGADLKTELTRAVQSLGEKSPEWKAEALHLTDDAFRGVKGTADYHSNLLAFAHYVHVNIGLRMSSHSILDRIRSEADHLQRTHEQDLKQWEQICLQTEEENKGIRQHNEKRQRLLEQAKVDYGRESAEYETFLRQVESKPASGEEAVPPQGEGLPASVAPPEPLEKRLRRIDLEFPLLVVKPLPVRPEPSPDLVISIELRDLLAAKLDEMGKRENEFEKLISQHLQRLKAERARVTSESTVNINEEFLEYLMGSAIRSIGRLLPRATRAYLTDPECPGLVYLVTYDYQGDVMTVRLGSNFLR